MVYIESAAENSFITSNIYGQAVYLGAKRCSSAQVDFCSLVSNAPLQYVSWRVGFALVNFPSRECAVVKRDELWEVSECSTRFNYMIEFNQYPPSKYRQFNDHFYSLEINGATWNGANTKALQSGGYPAEITSDEENNFAYYTCLGGVNMFSFKGGKKCQVNRVCYRDSVTPSNYTKWGLSQPDS